MTTTYAEIQAHELTKGDTLLVAERGRVEARIVADIKRPNMGNVRLFLSGGSPMQLDMNNTDTVFVAR